MEVTFGQNEQPAIDVTAKVTPVPAAQTPTPAPAPAPACSVPATVPTMGPPAKSGLALGDEIPEFKDIILPRLNLVQNIGGLKDSFPPGALVYNQATTLFVPPFINAKTNTIERQATPPVILTVIGFKPTRYSEKIEGGVKGMIVDTEDEVRAAGGTLDYAEWQLKKKDGMRRFEPLADALVAIQRPEAVADDDTIFTYSVEGVKYTLALWALHGTVYTAACKRVFFPARAVGCLRKMADGSGGYPTWAYAVSTREETYKNGNKSWVPVCVPARKNTVAFIEFVRSIIG